MIRQTGSVSYEIATTARNLQWRRHTDQLRVCVRINGTQYQLPEADPDETELELTEEFEHAVAGLPLKKRTEHVAHLLT